MLADVARRITPPGLRVRVREWLDPKLVKSRLLTFVFYYFIYGIVIRIRPMPNGNCLIASHGTEMIIPRDSVPIFIEIFRDGAYEQFSRLEVGNIVIAVGAHAGMFTVKAAKLVGDKGLVIAIEPEPRDLALLQHNIESHGLNNVKAISKAICDKAMTLRLYLQPHSGAHSLYHSSGNCIEMKLKRCSPL